MSQGALQHRISSWLASISAPQVAQHPCATTAGRPRKRARLEAQPDLYKAPDAAKTAEESGVLNGLPTPSASMSGLLYPTFRHGHVMSPSPSKRRRDDDDLTPRAFRTIAADESCSVASSSSYTSSSRESGSRYSPTKQIRHACLQPTGFRQASFELDPLPPSLQDFCQRLRLVHHGSGILPTRLRTEVSKHHLLYVAGISSMANNSQFAGLQLPDFFFHDDDADVAARRYPDRALVRQLLRRANECDLDGTGESSWNAEIHLPILAWLLQDESNGDGCLGSEYW